MRGCVLALLSVLPLSAWAGPPALGLPLLTGTSADELAGVLRGQLVRALPEPLYSDRKHWGQQAEPKVQLGRQPRKKNHGHWWTLDVTALEPANTLILNLRGVVQPEPGKTLFTVFVAGDVGIRYRQQTWHYGLRLHSGETRARARARLTLQVEITTQTVPNKTLLPDLVLRARVTQAQVAYDNLVVEHTAGVGGTAAQLLGQMTHGLMDRVKPDLERNALEKANAAIVKAADTKEVRLSLGKVVQRQGK
jgi:hypothetical protein